MIDGISMREAKAANRAERACKTATLRAYRARLLFVFVSAFALSAPSQVSTQASSQAQANPTKSPAEDRQWEMSLSIGDFFASERLRLKRAAAACPYVARDFGWLV